MLRCRLDTICLCVEKDQHGLETNFPQIKEICEEEVVNQAL